MEEEEHTDRKQQLAAIYQKLNKIKKSLNEGIGEKKSLVIPLRRHHPRYYY